MVKFHLILFLIITGFSVWSFPGQFNSTDGTDRYRTAHSILTRGLPDRGNLGDGILNSTFIDDDGEFRSYFGIGMSLMLIPLDIPGTLLVSILQPDKEMSFKIRTGLVSFLHLILVNWLLCLSVIRLGKTLDYNLITSSFAGLTAVFGTLLWNLARSGHEESWLAVLLVLAVDAGFKFKQNGKSSSLLIITVLLSAGLLFRPSFLTVVVTGAFWSLYMVRTTFPYQIKNWFLFWTGTAVLITGFYLLWNLFKTGNALDFGYGTSGGTFSGNPVNGFIQPLFGFDKGLLWTTPWVLPGLILVFWAWRSLGGKIKLLILLIGFLFAGNLAFHAFWFLWAGDHTYGARFQSHLVPLLALLFWGALLTIKKDINLKFRVALLFLIILLQVPSLCFWDTLEYIQANKTETLTVFENGSPTGNYGQISMRLSNIASKLKTGHVADFVQPAETMAAYSSFMTSWNFWPWTIEPYFPWENSVWVVSIWLSFLIITLGFSLLLFHYLNTDFPKETQNAY